VALLVGDASRAARTKAGFRGYTIHAAAADDSPAVRDLVEMTLNEYGMQLDRRGTDSDLDDVEASYLAQGGMFDVAYDTNGELAGSCGIIPIDAKTCELRKMYVAPEARGHGLGGRLLRRALAFARGRGFRRVELETASVLKEAIGLYAGAGFQRLDRPLHTSRCNQAYALDL
jgi:putative acetyltransferase